MTLDSELLRLGGGDAFDDVRRASVSHRVRHEGCRLYPAEPRVMSLAAQFVRAARPLQILDLGCGMGYSTLWLAAASPAEATVLGVDRDAGHVLEAQRHALQHGLGARARYVMGDAAGFLDSVEGPVDFVHDDAWFAAKPSHLERVLDLLRPGGLLTMPNWFLLEDALGDEPRRHWAEFAGPEWRQAVLDYAATLAADHRLDSLWVAQPPLYIGVGR